THRVCLVCRVRRPLRSTLFPYTTLFRSGNWRGSVNKGASTRRHCESSRLRRQCDRRSASSGKDALCIPEHPSGGRRREQRRCWRSEEHTSELQSRVDLVCRLLLENKKHL